MTPAALLDVLDVAYQVHQPSGGWLQSVADQLRPVIDQGEGALAFVMRERADGSVAIADLTPSGIDEYWRQWTTQMSALPQEVRRYARGLPPLVYKSHFTVAAMTSVPSFRMYVQQSFRASLRAPPANAEAVLAHDEAQNLPWAECLALHAGDPVAGDVFVVAPRRRRVSELPSFDTLHTWSRVMGHIANAYRLQQLVAAEGRGPFEGAEAVLAADGRVLDAAGLAQTPDARAVLREAARRRDGARTRSKARSVDEVTDQWRALIAGRWSLVDVFDHDGRRFVVARRNDLAASAPALSDRELQIAAYLAMGQSNKVIAYQMGVAVSTVATHTRRIAKKLGADSRVTLVEACAKHVTALQARPSQPAPPALDDRAR